MGMTFDEMRGHIAAAYAAELDFPVYWDADRRSGFIMEEAEVAALQASAKLDDLIDEVIETWTRVHHHLPESQTAAELVESAHELVLADIRHHVPLYSLRDVIVTETRE